MQIYDKLKHVGHLGGRGTRVHRTRVPLCFGGWLVVGQAFLPVIETKCDVWANKDLNPPGGQAGMPVLLQHEVVCDHA